MNSSNSDMKQQGFNVTQEDLESLADTYDKIRDLYKQNNLLNEKSLSKALESHLRNIISEMSEKVANEELDEVSEFHTIHAKYKIFGICVSKLAEFVEKSSPLCSQILMETYQKLEGTFICLLNKSIEGAEVKNSSVLAYNQRQSELDQVLRVAEDLEDSIIKLNHEKHELKEEIERIKEERLDYIEELERTNKSYLEKILRNAKSSISDSLDSTLKQSEFKEARPYSPFRPKSPAPHLLIHDLTLKQTKEMIEDLYTAKYKFDSTCLENSQPRETFENFIFIYFNQKYGLKTLCNQWLNLLSKALIKYDSNIQIRTFKKIRSNELNEEFLMIMKQLKEKTSDIVKSFFRNKQPYIQERTIRTLQEECVNGDVDEEVANYVVSCFLSKEKILKEKISCFLVGGKGPKKGKIINFNDLYNALSEMILEEYESRIEQFVNEFHIVDVEKRGMIGLEQFGDLHSKIGFTKSFEKCLETLDPFNGKRVIFSDFIVFCLTEKGIKDESLISIKLKN